MNPIKREFWRIVGRLIGRKQWCYSPITGWRLHTFIGKNFVISLRDDPKLP